MKSAILIAGYLRTFELNIHSLRDKILNKFNKADLFLHVTLNESDEDKYENKIDSKNIAYIKSILNPLVVLEEPNLNKYSDLKKNNVFNHWNKFYKLNLIKKDYEEIQGKYDIVIKYRPDMNLISEVDFNIEPGIVHIPKDAKIDKSKLLNENDKFICDIFAYGDSAAMDKYFDIRNNLEHLFDRYGYVPETILYHYLHDLIIKYDIVKIDYNILLSKCNVFAICGDSGSGKSTLASYLRKIFSDSFLLECDRYHKWERGDDNWKVYSHLNPNANYISKMNQDIFDLKIGKKIFQVDYDHKSGKFTDKEEIEASNNLIVCGLHSLYINNDAMYDLKIFMDTDKNLKYSWKAKRDVSQRGYTVEKVLEQIESRENDYDKYISPQKDFSDVIVNFFTDGMFTRRSFNENLNVKLNLLISKKLNISNIINSLIKNEVEFKYEDSGEYNKLIFTEYKYNKIFDFIGSNSYYDYIIFIILNLKK